MHYSNQCKVAYFSIQMKKSLWLRGFAMYWSNSLSNCSLLFGFGFLPAIVGENKRTNALMEILILNMDVWKSGRCQFDEVKSSLPEIGTNAEYHLDGDDRVIVNDRVTVVCLDSFRRFCCHFHFHSVLDYCQPHRCRLDEPFNGWKKKTEKNMNSN